MRKLRRTVISLAGLALAAGAALGGGMPAASAATASPSAASAPADIPPGDTEGFLVNAKSGKCLAPSRDDPLESGDLVVQLPCNGTAGQGWEFVPVGNQMFINELWPLDDITEPSYHIVNVGTGLCLDDRDGVSSDGAAVQEWACNSTSTSMMWAHLLSGAPDGSVVIFNARASRLRSTFMAMGMASGSTEDNVPAQLFSGSATTSMEFVYNRVT